MDLIVASARGARAADESRESLFSSARSLIAGEIVLTWVRTLFGAAAALVVGRIVAGIAQGSDPTGDLVWLGALLVLRALLAASTPLTAAATAGRVEADLRERILGVVLSVDRNRRTGDLVGKATEGVEAVGALGGVFLPQLIAGMSAPLLLLVVVALVDWPTALMLAALIPLIPLLLRMLEKRFASVSARYRQTADVLAARFLDGIQGLRTLKTLGRSRDYGMDLAGESERLRVETMSLLRVNQLALLAVDSLFTLATVVAASAMAGWRLSTSSIGVGDAVAIVLLGVLLIEPLTAIGRFFYVGAIGRAASDQIRELLAISPPPGQPRQDDIPPGAVELDNVVYTYPDGTGAIREVSLRVDPGERVALVGPSGAGKTTLAHLILGLMPPDRGTVRVGGSVTLVPQRPFLFHGSVAENLRLANPLATEDEMWAALEGADLASFVAGHPEGLEIPVGERGLNISGGEAQRLAIARALLMDAAVVVLDEPTSNVDLETEARIRASLDRLIKGRTVIVIAHRRSTIAGADRIIRLEHGRIATLEAEHLAGGPRL